MSLLESNAEIAALFRTRTARTADGDAVPVHSTIPLAYAEALYQTVLARRPEHVLEVGMAFGVSSLAILSALDRIGGTGRLVSLDPAQSRDWRGCGAAAVARSGLAPRHRLIEEPDYVALPRLLGEGHRIDFAYIDGMHTFDYTLLDFFYVDKLLPAGGVVGFNDCRMPAVHKVLRFVATHRRYRELDVGLPVRFRPKRRVRRALGRLLGQTAPFGHPMKQDRYFEKTEVWEPDWNSFTEF